MTPSVMWRPLSAAMSAVSAPCRRLPAAKTPGRAVCWPGSTRGPRVPSSRSMPPRTASSWSGIQSPVKTTRSHASRRWSAGVEVLHGHGLDAAAAMDLGHRGAGEQRRPEAQRGAGAEGCEGLVMRLGGHDRGGLGAAVLEGEQGGEADVLGADDDGAPAGGLAQEVDELLEHAGGDDALGAAAGHEARGARAFAAAGGKDDGAGAQPASSGRAGGLQGAVRGPPGRLGGGAELSAGVGLRARSGGRRSRGRT